MPISLGKLRSFVAVAEECQFSRAAERLGISQPSLSAQIKELEQVLEVSLLSRTTRSVTLTAEGKRFLNRARQMLADVDMAVLEMRQQSQLARGRIVIASTPSVSAAILPQAINVFASQFPEIEIQLNEDSFAIVQDLIESAAADFGFGAAPERPGTLAFQPLYRERFYAVLPAGHVLSKRSRLTLSDLLQYPLLSTLPGTSIRATIEHALRDQGLYLNTRHMLARIETVLGLVAAGQGVAILPALTLLTIDPARFDVLPITGAHIARDVGLLQRKGGSASSAADAFVQRSLDGSLFQALKDPASTPVRLIDGVTWY
ncbi:MAG: LysR family transcriptional regulator [Comamonas sp.]